jgi:hypothetical protein
MRSSSIRDDTSSGAEGGAAGSPAAGWGEEKVIEVGILGGERVVPRCGTASVDRCAHPAAVRKGMCGQRSPRLLSTV